MTNIAYKMGVFKGELMMFEKLKDLPNCDERLQKLIKNYDTLIQEVSKVSVELDVLKFKYNEK